MTDAFQTLSLVEGLPIEVRPSILLSACEIRREKHRQDKIDVALATSNLILGGFSEKADPLEAVKHMFTDEEYKQVIIEREEQRQRAIRIAQIEQLKRMAACQKN